MRYTNTNTMDTTIDSFHQFQTTLTFCLFLPKTFLTQTRCEAILRTNPNARYAKELHLAAIEGEEQRQQRQMKQAATGGVAAAAAVGLAAGVLSLLLKKR
jgi:hypothetical protein